MSKIFLVPVLVSLSLSLLQTHLTMSKRQADQDDLPQTKSTLGGQQRHPQAADTNGMGEFEDAWEDEIEEESEVEDMDQDNGDGKTRQGYCTFVIMTLGPFLGMELDEPVAEEDQEEEEENELRMYLPGQPLEEGEVLEADQSVYVMLHNLDVRLPFLSFDVLNDTLGDERKNVSSRRCRKWTGETWYFGFVYADLTSLVSCYGLCSCWYFCSWRP